MNYTVQIRQVEPQPILSIRAVVPTAELVAFFDDAYAEMLAYLAQNGVPTVGPPMSIWHSAPGQILNASDIETCWPIAAPVTPAGRMGYRELPAGLQAYTFHHGAYDDMVAAFDAVWQWIEAHGYAMAGPPRDVVLVGSRDTDAPAAYRTEIVYPIARR